MKVTSEQLLKLFGLKVGDKVRVSMIGTTDFIVIKYENDLYKLHSKVNGREYRDNITFLLDKDFEIIKQTPKLTEDEKVILRNIVKDFKWVARNKNGFISWFYDRPIRVKKADEWQEPTMWSYRTMFSDLFQFVKWEDEEPYNIKELLE